MTLYHTIVADPPWRYKTPGKIGKTLAHRPNRDKGLSALGSGSAARYGSMSLDELMALPVARHADRNAHLYLWSTNAFLVEAHVLAKAWGFCVKTVLTWTKIRHEDGMPSMKMGYYFRGATEHCLFAVRGKIRLRGAAASTALFAHRLPHSVKPEEFYQLVEQQSQGPYLEMFARSRRNGWDSWGKQVSCDVDLVARATDG